MQRDKMLVVALTLVLAMALVAPAVNVNASDDVTVGYVTLSSFDFLSASELSNFANISLDGETWNTWNTTEYGTLSATVSNGVLNITSTAGTVGSKEGFLVLPQALNGYVDVKLSSGVIGLFTNYNTSSTAPLEGYEIVKTSTGLTVYLVNGTSKTALSSLSTSADEVLVQALNGDFVVKLPDGTTVYTGTISSSPVVALGTLAGETATFDKVALYGIYLSGDTSVSLGTKTITPSAQVVSFTYDVSKYNPKTIKAQVNFNKKDDNYARYYAICTKDFSSVSAWWKADLSSYGLLKKGIVFGPTAVSVNLNEPKGTLYVGVSTFTGSWTVTIYIVLGGVSGNPSSGSDTDTETTTTSAGSSFSLNSKWVKYAAIGGFVLIILIVILAAAGGHRGRRGVGMLIAAFVMMLIMGGIAAAVLAWLHPEWLMAIAFGLGALAVLVLVLLIGHGGRTIPNPAKPG